MNPEMMKALEQVQRMQEEMEKAQAQLQHITATIDVGGGMVKVTANAQNEIVSIKLEKEVIDPSDQEMLEDLILTACNRALSKAKQEGEEKINSITSQFMPNIPGLPFMK